MATITPRGDEWKPVLEIMEDTSFKDGKAMATAVVKSVYDSLTMREWYVLVIGGESRNELAYGPYSSPGDATKAAKKLGSGAFRYGIVKIYPSGVLEGNLQGRAGGGFGFCLTPECGHAQWLHEMDGTSRGGCSEPTCSCKKLKKG